MLKEHEQNLTFVVTKDLQDPSALAYPLLLYQRWILTRHRTDLLTLAGLHPIQAFPTYKDTIKSKIRELLSNQCHFAILKATLAISIVGEEEVPLKILSFLSLQLDHEITKGNHFPKSAYTPNEMPSKSRLDCFCNKPRTTRSKIARSYEMTPNTGRNLTMENWPHNTFCLFWFFMNIACRSRLSFYVLNYHYEVLFPPFVHSDDQIADFLTKLLGQLESSMH